MTKQARVLTHLILLYTSVEGLVINIGYPSKLPYLYKDLAILTVYALTFLRDPGRLLAPSPSVRKLAFPLACFAAVTATYLLHPQTDPVGGAVALKQRLFYIPLLSVGYLFVTSAEDLRRLMGLVVLYAVGASAFGVFLFFSGPESLRQLGADYFVEYHTAARGADTGTYWRVPGTFTSPGQYGSYLLFGGLTASALLMTDSLAKRWRVLSGLSLALVILAMFASGSRMPFLLLSSSAIALVLLARKPAKVAGLALVGYAMLAVAFLLLGPSVLDRFASIFDYEHVERFHDTYFGQLFLPAMLEEPLGSGLGVATLGARHFATSDFQLMESYLGILAVETGVVGLVGFSGVMIAILALVLRCRRPMRHSGTAVPWYALALYVVSMIVILPVSAALDAAPSNVYFWFAIGLLVKTADLERRKRSGLPVRIRGHAPVARRMPSSGRAGHPRGSLA